ncbi:polysaccharide lyase [Nonomuraea harbinensis]|uniref:Polysaccharide lyase n=1 Tax=Nonomuraea harbinensis TaxID=1286938 RepID=A0ABW1BLE0_9ACTN|nr:polysaccharide lyase [Nonomuraea harbinensis]
MGKPRQITAAALAVAGLTTAGAPAPASAELAAAAPFRVDYENGAHPKVGLNECCSHSITVDDLPRTGEYAVRSVLKYGDPKVAGSTRAESHTLHAKETHFRSGDTVYYGFSVYLLSTWQRDSREDIVFQWKPWSDACETGKFPSAFLSVQPSGKWRLRVNSDGNACSTPESVRKTSFDLVDVKPGQWHDFVFRFTWSHGSQGKIDGWHQTHKNPGWRKVLTAGGPNTFNDDKTTSGYLKWGIYKPAWASGKTDVDSRTIFHDNIAVGTTFSEVNPASSR